MWVQKRNQENIAENRDTKLKQNIRAAQLQETEDMAEIKVSKTQ